MPPLFYFGPIASILLLVLLATPWHSSFGQDEDVNRVLQNLVAGVEAAPSGQAREDRAGEMLRYVANQLDKSAAIDDQTIDRIAELLRDSSGAVKECAALSLGKFGARAQRALPALRHALNELVSEYQLRYADESGIAPPLSGPNSISSTRFAIRMIEKAIIEEAETE